MGIIVNVNLEGVECFHCQAVFGMTDTEIERLRRNHKSFYCPYCKGGQCYPGTSDLEKLKNELAITNRSLDYARRDTDFFKRSAASHKGKTTELKNRAAFGVCPCCKRSFKQLRSHMKNKHPEFVEEHK